MIAWRRFLKAVFAVFLFIAGATLLAVNCDTHEEVAP